MTTLRFEVDMRHQDAEGQASIASPVMAVPALNPVAPGPPPVLARRPLMSASSAELRDWMVERGYPAYRARQVRDWVIRRRAESFEPMSDLPKSLRQELDAEWIVFATRLAYHQVAPDGTDKLVLECLDGRRVECVLMGEQSRRTVCVSTQVGCGMGCVFCASGLKGVERNLSAGEILEQVLHSRNLLPPAETITHVVVMGMGESLANFDNLIAALDQVCSAAEGLGISQRRVTISTVGLPDRIMKLAALDRQYHLAVSLHAPTEALRNRLIPVNKNIGLNAVLTAADAYFERTGRQVTYEYVVLRGINDRPADAQALTGLLANRRAHVNLIPYNPVVGLPFERPDPESVRRFTTILKDGGVSVTIRKTKGQAIDAACGQLRRRLERNTDVGLAAALEHERDRDPGRDVDSPAVVAP